MNVLIWIVVLFTAYFYSDPGSTLQNAIFTWYLAPTALLMGIFLILFLFPSVQTKHGEDQPKIMMATLIPVVNLIFSFMFIVLAIVLIFQAGKAFILKIFTPKT